MSYDDPALALIMKGPIANKIAMMKIGFFMSAAPFYAFFMSQDLSCQKQGMHNLKGFSMEIYMILTLKFSRYIPTPSYLVCLTISFLLEGSLIGKNIGVETNASKLTSAPLKPAEPHRFCRIRRGRSSSHSE
jgi:hypothetical protein